LGALNTYSYCTVAALAKENNLGFDQCRKIGFFFYAATTLVAG
jgi:hypothetical protein